LKAALTARAKPAEASVPASADAIVYSNLGPGNAYSGEAGLNVRSDLEWAAAFTPKGDFSLTQIDVAFTCSNCSTASNSGMLSLEGSNSHGLPDGMPLESFTLTDLPRSPLSCASSPPCVIQPSQIAMSTKPVNLFNGTDYWLVASAINPTINAWRSNIVGATVPVAINQGHGFTFFSTTAPAFAVLGTPVPEPATLGLMVLGLLGGAGFVGRKRRNCPRLLADTKTPVATRAAAPPSDRGLRDRCEHRGLLPLCYHSAPNQPNAAEQRGGDFL